MKPVELSIYIGGALHVGWAVFHLLFPRIFGWRERLKDLDPVNRGIYQIINLCLAFWFAVAAYISLRFAGELLQPGLGKKLLAVFTAFWLLRFSLQFKFFKPSHPVSLLLSFMFLATMASYAFPLLAKGAH